jgi:hypothetical protein
MYRPLLLLAIGAVLGALWLLAIGIPFGILPSYLDLRSQAEAAESLAAGQAEAFDESEDLRDRESTAAIGAVDDERGSCQARLDSQAQGYERAIDEIIAGYEDGIDEANMCADRGLRSVERVLDGGTLDEN